MDDADVVRESEMYDELRIWIGEEDVDPIELEVDKSYLQDERDWYVTFFDSGDVAEELAGGQSLSLSMAEWEDEDSVPSLTVKDDIGATIESWAVDDLEFVESD